MALLAETEVGIGQVSEDAALASVVSPNRLTGRSPDQRNRLRAARDQLLNDLARPSSSAALAIIVAPKPPAPREPTHDFVFRPDPGYTFTCATAAADTLTRTPEINTLVIRKGADELSKVGEEIKSAGSAQLVFDDFRTTNLAGEEKRTVKLIVNAAAGLAIPGIARSANQHLFAYAEYSRSRVRVRTSPVSATPEDDGSADDVDALEVGLLGTALLGNVVQTNGRIGYIDDAITGARYLAGGLALSPKTGGRGRLGFCGIGAYQPIGLGFEARCTASIEADLRQILRSGNAKLTDADRLFAAGGSATLTLQRGLDQEGEAQDGPIANLTYRYLANLSGRGPDIDRLDASLAYRWWAGDVGFDLGLTYVDGTERKSLADEHRFGFTVGVIY